MCLYGFLTETQAEAQTDAEAEAEAEATVLAELACQQFDFRVN